MKKYLPLILIALAFVILLTTLKSVSPLSILSPTPTPIPWVEFNNQFKRFGLKYPQNWFSDNDKNLLTITNYDKNSSGEFDNWDNKIKIEVSITDRGNETLKQWIEAKQKEGPVPVEGQIIEKNISGSPGYLVKSTDGKSEVYHIDRGIYVYTLAVFGDLNKYRWVIDEIVNSFSLHQSTPDSFWLSTAYQNPDFGFEFGYPDFLTATHDTDRIIFSQRNPYNSSFDFVFYFWPEGGEYPKQKGYIYKDITSDGYVYRFVFDPSAKDDYINEIVSSFKII
jgi:uncharacterized protein (UPF0297 family)